MLSSLPALMGLLEGVACSGASVGGAANTNTACTAATMCNCDLCVNAVGLGPRAYKNKALGSTGGGNKRGFFAGSLIWFYLSERALFPLLEPGRGSLPSLELMVSQPDGFIKRTDAAGPCQGQEGNGSGSLARLVHGKGAPCQGGLHQVEVVRGGHVSPGPSSAKVLLMASSTARVSFKTDFLQEALQD